MILVILVLKYKEYNCSKEQPTVDVDHVIFAANEILKVIKMFVEQNGNHFLFTCLGRVASLRASLMAQMVKNLPAMWEMQI